ncbi:hypothetical protein LXL04_004349 [Taraxacum kok-saghyz]
MGDASQSRFKPPPEFQEVARAPVIEHWALLKLHLYQIYSIQKNVFLIYTTYINIFILSRKPYDVVVLQHKNQKPLCSYLMHQIKKLRFCFVRYLEVMKFQKMNLIKEIYSIRLLSLLTIDAHQSAVVFRFTTKAKTFRDSLGGAFGIHTHIDVDLPAVNFGLHPGTKRFPL